MRTLHTLHRLDVEPGDLAVTVRNGPRWADSLGVELSLCTCVPDSDGTGMEEVVVGTGVVVGVWQGLFANIPARLTELADHLPASLYSGLLADMQWAYGDDFGPDNRVTAITYRRNT